MLLVNRGALCLAAMLVLPLPLLVGCDGGPVPVSQPDFDPARTAAQAMELYDVNRDGMLSEKELAACPGILMNRSLYDTDGNGAVSRQEIEERLRDLRQSGVGLTQLSIDVRLNGKPLRGAEVQLIPEPYLGPNVKPAFGKAGQRGLAVMNIPDSELPETEHGLTGIHYGTYKLAITHPEVQLPAKYNSQTTLGYETQRGNPSFRVELKK